MTRREAVERVREHITSLCSEESAIYDPLTLEALETVNLIAEKAIGAGPLIDQDYAVSDLVHDYAYAAADMIRNHNIVIPADTDERKEYETRYTYCRLYDHK